MISAHNLSSQITGIKDLLDDLETIPDDNLVKGLLKKIESLGKKLAMQEARGPEPKTGVQV